MMLVQPVASAALAWLIFGETLMPLQTVGGAVVLAGIAIAQAPARHGAAVDDHEAA
jgi:drug/metabolite transporter (DMT)-like permease